MLMRETWHLKIIVQPFNFIYRFILIFAIFKLKNRPFLVYLEFQSGYLT